MIWPDICARCGEPHEQPTDGMTRAEPCADRLALLALLRARPTVSAKIRLLLQDGSVIAEQSVTLVINGDVAFNAEVIDFPVWTGTWTDVYSELEITGAEHARAQQGPYQLDSGSFVRFPRGEIVADVLET